MGKARGGKEQRKDRESAAGSQRSASTTNSWTHINSELQHRLGLFDVANIALGCILGSGIFIVPAITASLVRAPSMVLLVWIIGGGLTFCGALAYGEVGVVLFRAGGSYVFLREAFGPLPAFLYGWTVFLIIQTGALAALAAAFSIYLGYFIPLTECPARLVSAVLVFLLAAVNCVGLRLGASVRELFKLIKASGVVAIVGVAFTSSRGSLAHFAPFWPTSSVGLLGAIGAAMVGVLWAYEGWHGYYFLAGEVFRPGRNIRLALALAAAMSMLFYLGATLAYLYLLPSVSLIASQRVAADAVKVALGDFGGSLISVLILLSVADLANSITRSGPRAYYAMAGDGRLFARLKEIHPRFQTPIVAILAQASWAAILALTGRYDQLFTYVIFASWLVYGLTVAGVIVLRRRHRDWPWKHQIWGYPVLLGLFSLAALAIVISTLLNRPNESARGLLILLLGVPAYFFWRGHSRHDRQSDEHERNRGRGK